MNKNINKRAFSGDEVLPPEDGIKNIKLDNKKSRFKPAEEVPPEYNFEERAEALQQKIEARNKKGIELASLFMTLMRSKILGENRSSVADQSEGDLRKELITWLVEINNDPDEELDGMGSAGIITLLLKTFFIQRDKINGLEYRLEQLEKELGVNSERTQ